MPCAPQRILLVVIDLYFAVISNGGRVVEDSSAVKLCVYLLQFSWTTMSKGKCAKR